MRDRETPRRAILACTVFIIVFAIGGASAGAVGGGKEALVPFNETTGELDGRHVYVVPATPEGKAAMDAANAETIASYASYTLVSADGSANDVLAEAGADLRDDMSMVAVADGQIDPSGEPKLAASAGSTLVIVQFVGPIKDSWLEALRQTGATVVTYISENAYVVYATGAQSRALAALAGAGEVRAVTPFTAAAKAAPGIDSTGTVEVAVETIAGAPGAAAHKVLAEGEELRAHAAYGGTVTKFAALDADDLGALAADPGVVSVEPWVEPELLDERAAAIVAGRVNPGGTTLSPPNYLSFLTSNGFPTTVATDTIDITHEGWTRGVSRSGRLS